MSPLQGLGFLILLVLASDCPDGTKGATKIHICYSKSHRDVLTVT